MISIATLLVASTVSVPPGELTVNHGHKYQFTQPTQRYFTRRHEDEARGKAWMGYVDELDALWAEYRAAGSTPEAWEIYKTRAAAAKRCYVYQDPYYLGQVYYVRYVRPEDYRNCADGRCNDAATPVAKKKSRAGQSYPTNHGHAAPGGGGPKRAEVEHDVLVPAPEGSQGSEPVVIPYDGAHTPSGAEFPSGGDQPNFGNEAPSPNFESPF